MTKQSKIIIIIAVFLLLIISLAGWIAGGFLIFYKLKDEIKSHNGNSNLNTPVYDSLEKFSANEFDDYISQLKKAQEETSSGSLSGVFDAATSLAEGGSLNTVAPTATKDSESITNVQETGVDEGDIVKAYGDYLVILSRGKLFSVQVKSGDEQLIKPIYKTTSYPEGFTKGTWFDEMLIDGNKIVVIGYTYELSATEIGIFNIDNSGTISHQATYFIDSNDYYSSRNYASRLVDGKLIFYMPYYLSITNTDNRATVQFPQIKKWIKDDELSPGQDLLSKSEIYKPVEAGSATTLHSVVTCDLSDSNFNCTGKAVLGSYGRTFYVSPTAVYIWVANYNYYSSNTKTTELMPDSYVYAMSLNGDSAKVLKAYGAPIDQFSFKESSDGYLNVLVQQEGLGDAMFNAEYNDSNLALARFPLTEFSVEPEVLAKKYYQVLPRPEGYTLQNRFVGDYLLYGSGSGWWEDNNAENNVYVLKYNESILAKKIALKNTVDRIEVLDNNNAVVIGSNTKDLLFNWINLDPVNSTLADTYTMADAAQGETRSHGFFYSSSQNILGLPIRESLAEGYWQLIEESSKIVYLSLDQTQKKFVDLGILAADEKTGYVEDDCLYSCTDWYGNSRPIFYSGRIFGLMGYELVEGQLVDNKIKENSRVNFYQDIIPRE